MTKPMEKIKIDFVKGKIYEYSEKDKCFYFECHFYDVGANKCMQRGEILSLYYSHKATINEEPEY